MKKLFLLFAVYVICSSHDMFLKMGTFYLQPNTPATIKLYNGTFDVSDNVIARSRMNDVSMVGNGQRTRLDSSQWSELNNMTLLNFQTGSEGTWVAGVSTNPRSIELAADDFNGYLEHDGVLDMLAWRKENNALNQDAIERYSKHVKTIFQVGDNQTDDWQTMLGYPIEFVPLSNPYAITAGGKLKVKLLWRGQPLADQLVYVGSDANTHSHDHSHAEDHNHSHSHDATQLRTDAQGIVTMDIANEGHWYLRTIYMEQIQEAGLTHESNWATLTFEIGHGHSHADGDHHHDHNDGHSHDDHSHSHEQDSSSGMPWWAYGLGAVAILGLLVMARRRK